MQRSISSGIEKQCRITSIPVASRSSTASVSAAASRVWMISGLAVSRASAMWARNARAWSSGVAPAR